MGNASQWFPEYSVDQKGKGWVIIMVNVWIMLQHGMHGMVDDDVLALA
jgi:hypothetical protein